MKYRLYPTIEPSGQHIYDNRTSGICSGYYERLLDENEVLWLDAWDYKKLVFLSEYGELILPATPWAVEPLAMQAQHFYCLFDFDSATKKKLRALFRQFSANAVTVTFDFDPAAKEKSQALLQQFYADAVTVTISTRSEAKRMSSGSNSKSNR